MIDRLQLIRNVGQFDSVNSGAEIPLARLTLVYSENGRGKTTLAAVLRSLATGSPLPITERRRIAAEHPPHVVLASGNGQAPFVFQEDAWSRTLTDLVVFDDVFIDENVHSGLDVDAHHRQKLHEVILGPQAIALSARLQELVSRIEEHNRELRTRQAEIPQVLRGRLTVDQFCALALRPDVNEAIEEAERALASAKQQDEIRTRPAFEIIGLPELENEPIENVLRLDLPSIETATLERVERHIAAMSEGGEAWIADGMGLLQTGGGDGLEVCPFCAQDLKGSSILQHYRAYFGEEYGSLKGAVEDEAARMRRTHGGGVPAGFERSLRVAGERRQFWSQFCEVPDVEVDTAAIVRDWEAAREAVLEQLGTKVAAPLEPMTLSQETRDLVQAYEARRRTIATLNQELSAGNERIAVVKERAAAADMAVLTDDLAQASAAKVRYEPATTVLCDAYLQEKAAKEATETERDQIRANMERQRAQAFPGYQVEINRFLARFNAGFRLDNVAYANTRGGPTCTYSVLINETPVQIGGAEPEPGERSFRNTLSAGDRNTLALAFFFASLYKDPNLAGRIVVIDDPISSLDDHRTLATIQEIRQLAARAAQVIVLSHNKPFLCRLWEGADRSLRASLEVVRHEQGSTLRAWDVRQDSVTEHDRRDASLYRFVGNGTGEVREIARMIRPHLEAYLRVVFPAEFSPGTLLGPFQKVCRQRLGTDRELLSERPLGELHHIVEYANRFHHDTNPAWETVAINSAELEGFVRRALSFVRP